MKRGRDLLLLDAIVAGCGVSSACLGFFWWGMRFMQDYWDASRFVACLIGGLVAAVVSVVVSERLRRAHKAIASSGLGRTVAGAAWLLLGVQIFVFLYCTTGPVRSAVTVVVRRAVTYGMATDLPLPSP